MNLETQLKMDGGICINVSQVWFGHKAKKDTTLYIKGLSLDDLPKYKVLNTQPTHQVSTLGSLNKYGNLRFGCNLPSISKKEREITPPAFADWLIKICRLIELKKKENGGKLQDFGQMSLIKNG